MPNIHKFKLLLTFSLIVCYLCACSESQETVGENEDSQIVVTVNGKQLTRNQLHHEVVNLLLTVGSDLPVEVLMEKRTDFEIQAIQNLINTELMVEEARRRDLDISEDDVSRQIVALRAAYESIDQYAAELKIRDLTDAQLYMEAQRGLLVEKLINEVKSRIPPVDTSEVDQFYAQNKEYLTRPEQVRVSHVFIQILPDDSQIVKDAKRTELDRLKKSIDTGAIFEEVAKAHSDCASNQSGGDLGWISRDMMPPTFVNTAFALPIGSVSDIVETESGYHLIKKQDQRQPYLPDLDEIRNDLIRYIGDMRVKSAIQSLVENLRSSADIQIVTVP